MVSETGIARIDNVLGILVDREQTLDNRAAAYGVLQQVKLRLDRGLKANRDDIVKGMQADGLKELGPLSIKSTAVEPVYVCNLPENHEDLQVQEALEELTEDRALRPYVRLVPRHFEIDVDRMVEDIRLGVQAALNLFQILNVNGWRTERDRRYSLAVREVVAPKKEAAA
jgi:hypothetical protein